LFSRGDCTAFELFVQGVNAWEDDVKRLAMAASIIFSTFGLLGRYRLLCPYPHYWMGGRQPAPSYYTTSSGPPPIVFAKSFGTGDQPDTIPPPPPSPPQRAPARPAPSLRGCEFFG
jgi:hypothetical protein